MGQGRRHTPPSLEAVREEDARMVPASFANYFLATAGAGGALIGLLFVAVSINPERTFGSQAHPLRQGVASGAFAALVNGFFVSAWALLPLANVGYVTLLVGAASVINSGRFGAEVIRRQWGGRAATRVSWRGAIRVLGVVGLSLALYGYESALAVLLLVHPDDMGAVYALGGILLGVYAVGLVRAWELLGAPRGLIMGLNPLDERWAAGERTGSAEGGSRADRRAGERGDGGEGWQ